MIDKAMKEIMKTTCIEFSPYNKVLGWSKCPEIDDGISELNAVFSTQPQPRLLCFTKTISEDCQYVPQGVLKIKGRVLYRNMGYIQLGASPDCFQLSTVLHEIMHALGFDHEHQRPDRDNFVRLGSDYIEDSDYKRADLNYALMIKPFMKTYGLPYDVCSIMHYRNRQGVRKLPNVTSECGLKEFGLQHTLSTIDITKINIAYNCKHRPSTFGGFRPGSYLFKHFGNSEPSYEVDVAIKTCLSMTISMFLIFKHQSVFVALRKVSYSTIFLIQAIESIVNVLFYFEFIAISNCTTNCQFYSADYLTKFYTGLFPSLAFLNIIIVFAKTLTFFHTSNYHPFQINDLKLYIHKDVSAQKVRFEGFCMVLDDKLMCIHRWLEKVISIALMTFFIIFVLDIINTLFMVIAPLIEFWRDPFSSIYWCEDTRHFLDYFYN